MRPLFFALGPALLLASSLHAAPVAVAPPVANKIPHLTVTHGDTLRDDYFWMREKTNPEVLKYLEAENAYADAVMDPTKPLQDQLYTEMLGRVKETDENVPYKKGGYFYYSRTEQGKQYAIQCRRKGSMDAPEEVMLDLNEMAKGMRSCRSATWK
jgi:oligopeptidase B